jgi:hypothetical protein
MIKMMWGELPVRRELEVHKKLSQMYIERIVEMADLLIS